MKRKAISGIVVFLLLMSIGMVASVVAVVNDYDIRIEIIPSTIPQGGTVTFRIHADLVSAGYGPLPPEDYLLYVTVRGFPALNSPGIFVKYPDGTSSHYSQDLSPITIWNGVPSEDLDYVDITFGTIAPDKDDWMPPSSTDLSGLYTVTFYGFLYMTDGSDHWLDIGREFTVTPPGEEWEGYTPGWWGLNAEKLLGYCKGKPQMTLEEYQTAVDCVYGTWSSDLPWLPTDVQGACDIFNAEPKSDPMIKARIQLLAFLLTLCHFGDDFAPVTITGPLGTYTYTPAEWATFLIEHYNMGHYEYVYYYADALNNY